MPLIDYLLFSKRAAGDLAMYSADRLSLIYHRAAGTLSVSAADPWPITRIC
jgi:hypothetical protein